MNPLDTKLRRNRFSGFAARNGSNALARSNWNSKNPDGTPIPKLGLVWNALINGLCLIESISDELTDSWRKELKTLYRESLNGNFEEWASSRTPREMAQLAEHLPPSPLRKWLEKTDLKEDSHSMRKWFMFEGGASIDRLVLTEGTDGRC